MNPNKPDDSVPDPSPTVRHRWPQPNPEGQQDSQPYPAPPQGPPPQGPPPAQGPYGPPQGHPQAAPPYGQPQQGGPHYGQPPQDGPHYGAPPHTGPQHGGPQYGAPPQTGPHYGAPPHTGPQHGGPQYGAPPQTGPHYGTQPQGPQYGAAQQEQYGTPPKTRRLDYTPDLLPPVPEYEPVKAPKSAWWWVVLVGGIALVVAILAVAVILWTRSSNATAAGTTPLQSQQQDGSRVIDTKSKVSYALPGSWQQSKDGLFKPFTSSAGPKTPRSKDEGAVVVAFPHAQRLAAKPSAEQLQAQAKSVAFQNAEFFMPQPATKEAVTTRSLEIGGQPAASVSFRLVFKDATRSPAYVRTIVVFTGGDSMSYVYGSTAPDGVADRAAIDQIMDSVRPG